MTPAPQSPDPVAWIGPVCPACSRLLPRGAPQNARHTGARPELRANDPHWSRRTVKLDGQPVPGATEVVPEWRRGDTLVVRTEYGRACRCGRLADGSLYAVVASGRVVVG